MFDFHLHTNNSDGIHTELEVLKKCEDTNLEIISITDHDNVDSYFKLKDIDISKYYSGKIIVGCEFKCIYNDISIEILGYGIDILKIKKYVENNKKIIMNKQIELFDRYKRICDSLGLKYNDNKIIYGQFASASMYLVMEQYFDYNKNIIDERYIDNSSNFFRKCVCNKESPFYTLESDFTPNINEVISKIKEADGISFVAHSGIYSVGNNIEFLESIFKNTKIDGAECYYPLHSKEYQNSVKKLCQKYNKYTSGGSDYHGNNSAEIGMINFFYDDINWTEKINYFKN